MYILMLYLLHLFFLPVTAQTLFVDLFVDHLLQSSGQQIPVVVESCIRFINLHGGRVLLLF